jgi:hypothetical protein
MIGLKTLHVPVFPAAPFDGLVIGREFNQILDFCLSSLMSKSLHMTTHDSAFIGHSC